MTLRSFLNATGFALAHITLVAPFVPVANILPAGMGALAMTSMALCLILAARWRIVDRLTGGPDKSYALHRYLGFFALTGTLGHWALASSVGAGVLPLLADGGADVGNIAAFGLLGLTAAAMVRAIPYHLWKLSHMAMGPIFLIAAYHTFFVASPLAVGALPWWTMAIVSTIGLLAWVQTLRRKRSPTRLMQVEKVTHFGGGVDITLRAEAPMAPFRPGQFATLAWNEAGAETHPFTIAGGNDTTRRFVIRSGGDWTGDFVAAVTPGSQLRVGAGEGRFLPDTSIDRRAQLWVAGGVGITPFLAALDAMVPDHGAPITLIYCLRTRDDAPVLWDVERHAARLPQLDLIVLTDDRDEGLTPEKLAPLLRAMPSRAQAYLCGPDALKQVVIRSWQETGMTGRIHDERFDFRGAYGLTDLRRLGKRMGAAVLDRAAWMKAGRHATSGS